MNECEEVAAAMPYVHFENVDAARDHVRRVMPDESVTVIDNVAAALYARGKIDRNFEAFLDGYLACAFWSSIDEQPGGNSGPPMDDNYGPEDLAEEAAAAMRADALSFYTAQLPDLTLYAEERESVRHRGEGTAWDHAGHDLWLTRNGHGAGFWDRGLGELGDRLAAAARLEGSCDLYVGDDGKVHAA